jgi:hypothetical protein
MTNVMILTFNSQLYFLYSNMPLSPAYGMYISQLIQYTRTSQAILTTDKKLMLQGYNESRLNNHFANSTVAMMILFAITNYHSPIC